MADMDPQSRVVAIILAMAGREIVGVRNSELADALHVTRSAISRDLAKLQELGIVETMPTDPSKYRLGPKLIQIARAHMEGIALIQAQIDQIQQRYSRQPS